MVPDLAGMSEMTPPDGTTVPVKAQREAAKFVNWLVANNIDRVAAVEGVQKFLVAVLGKRRQAKAPTAQGPAIRTLVAHYIALYRTVYREDLKSPAGMEIAHLAKLARDYSVPVVESRLTALARYVKEDPFMARLGFKPSTLVNQWIRVTAYSKQHQANQQASAPRDCKHDPPCVDARAHTQLMLQDFRS